jgi:small subunit ribosomal protein S2
MEEENEKLLLPREKYLASGVHIGMTVKTADMKKFVYKIRPNGLAVLNISVLDERIRSLAKFIASKKNVIVVGHKDSAIDSLKKFSEVTGIKIFVGRFMPGSLTNPTYKEFMEPDALIIIDPSTDKQAIKEAVEMRIPIIAFADTSNKTSYVDFVLPCNNKAKKSIAIVLWLLAKEILRERGLEFSYDPKDFSYE